MDSDQCMKHVTRGLDLVSLPSSIIDQVHDSLEVLSPTHCDLVDRAFDLFLRELLAHLRIVKRRLGKRVGPSDFPRQ